MTSYENFQRDNNKYTRKDSRMNHNPEFNNSVNAMGQNEGSHLEKYLDSYVEFLSWARWYP